MTGRRFGPYELEELLGRGGMGEVWRAVDTRKQRTVALKLLPGELGGQRDVEERFRREAQVAARLSDPHVIPIHDYGEVHGRLYLDMRLVQGVDLAKTLKSGGALPPARAVSIVGQVADALDAAHDDGLVHRDVKPSNILLTTSRRGSDDFVYLIDFGIAAGSMLGTRLTATGHAVGTAAYMAPERFTEDREADGRVDVYALGCVLHEMLTGSAPFEGTSFPNLMYQHLHAPPPRPSASIALRPGFDAVVATALAKDPARRYRRAGDLAEAARAVLVAPRPVRVGPPSAPQVPGPPPGPGARPAGIGPSPVPQGLAPEAPRDPAPPPPAAPGRSAGAVTAAVVAIVAIVAWSAITVFGTVVTFAQCANSPLGCVGGGVGVASAAVAVVGVVAAAGALRGRRGAGRAWICVAATLVLTLVMAGFGAASS